MDTPNIDKSEYILGIDPGTSKSGIALLDVKGNVIHKLIIHDNSQFREELKKLIKEYNPRVIILGNGTGSSHVEKLIRETFKNEQNLIIIDETGTTELARKSWFDCFPAFKRFFITISYILGLIRPEFDDKVAVLLVKKYLSDSRNNQ